MQGAHSQFQQRQGVAARKFGGDIVLNRLQRPGGYTGFRRMLADHWDEVHGLSGRAALKKQLGHAAAASDVTERHYISRNQRRIAREIGRWHVSPLSLTPLDWTRFPVHMGAANKAK